MLTALRENFNETVAKEIAAAGPEIGKALQAVEELMKQELQSLNSASVITCRGIRRRGKIDIQASKPKK